MTVITMSRKELSRLQILIGLADGRTRVDDAAALMGMGRRQVYRLLDAFRTDIGRCKALLIFDSFRPFTWRRLHRDAFLGSMPEFGCAARAEER